MEKSPGKGFLSSALHETTKENEPGTGNTALAGTKEIPHTGVHGPKQLATKIRHG
jgi:hypothetical protein